jgi:hypothetical protein
MALIGALAAWGVQTQKTKNQTLYEKVKEHTAFLKCSYDLEAIAPSLNFLMRSIIFSNATLLFDYLPSTIGAPSVVAARPSPLTLGVHSVQAWSPQGPHP